MITSQIACFCDSEQTASHVCYPTRLGLWTFRLALSQEGSGASGIGPDGLCNY